jgi:glycosyltransferase involved in cell wall biosynthesis
MIRFTIMIPTRNRLDLLGYAIETVRRQDYDNWEIIVSDNASEQDVEGYVNTLNEGRIVYRSTPAFVTVTENWNNALAGATGDYVIMLGDDDGLVRGCLKELDRIIRDFDDPDFIYTDTIQFAYPGVIPNELNGFFQRGYASFLRAGAWEPYWLDPREAKRLVRQSCNFRLPFVYNMQHSVINRKVVKSLSEDGPFFQSPYPDYYATNSLFLNAERILINPTPLFFIGISPKSFGYYYFNKRESEGNYFLNNEMESTIREKLQRIILPGSDMNTSWLAAMESVRLRHGAKYHLAVNYARYRWIQTLGTYEEMGGEAVNSLKRHLTKWELARLQVLHMALRATRYLLGEDAYLDLRDRIHVVSSPYPLYDTQKQTVDHVTILDVFKAVQFNDPQFLRKAVDVRKAASRLQRWRRVLQVRATARASVRALLNALGRRSAHPDKVGHVVDDSMGQLQHEEWRKRYQRSLEERARLSDAASRNPRKVGIAPRFSIITTVYDTPVSWVKDLAFDINAQEYTDFEWLVLDNGSTRDEVRQAIAALPERDRRVKVFRVEKNLHIVPGNRFLLERANGEFVIPVDSDDVLCCDALRILAAYRLSHPEADLLYSDEQKVDINGDTIEPILRRPTWSGLYVYSTCPAAHLMAFRRELGLRAGVYSETYAQGSHDWDTGLRLTELGVNACHVPYVLYGWRVHSGSMAQSSGVSKQYAFLSQRNNILASLRRRGMVDRFRLVTNFPGYYHLIRTAERGPRVAAHFVLNTSEDVTHLLRNLKMTRYDPLELHVHCARDVVSAGSLQGEVYDACPTRSVPIHYYNELKDLPGALTRINSGVDYVALVQSGFVLRDPHWLWDAIGAFELSPDVGIVGGRIVDVNGRILHVGYTGGVSGFFDSLGRGLFPHDLPTPLAFIRDHVTAVNSGLSVFRARLLQQGLGPRGIDTDGGLWGIDWCLRCREEGILAAYTPRMSATACRTLAPPSEQHGPLREEIERLYGKIITADPNYHKEWSRDPTRAGLLDLSDTVQRRSVGPRISAEVTRGEVPS